MILDQVSFKKLTAPGYFDFSGQQTSKTKSMVAWFDSFTRLITDNVNIMDDTFRLWASRNYSGVTVTMTPWLSYLLYQNGIGWFSQSVAVAVALLSYLSKSYPTSTIECLQQLFDFLLGQGWITSSGQIYFGSEEPARFAEAFVIYSNSGTLPATPAPSSYIPLEWTAPSGWSIVASSATYYTRGYISGTNIIWMNPQSTSIVYMMIDVANLASLPASASIGQLCGVYNDGTGDVGAVYYYDGAVWRKTTGINSNQGLVTANIPPSPGSTVFDPGTGFSSSEKQPPVSGPSQGYGYYGIYGQVPLHAKRIDIVLNLTTTGLNYFGIIIILFRKIKPTLLALYINYTTPTNSNLTEIEITDSGAL